MKKGKWFVPVILILVLGLIPGSALAGGFNLAGVGAKALSMSGAFRAISDDWSAMYWNPAGLAGQSTHFALEAKVLYPMSWVTPNAPSMTGGDLEYDLYVNDVEQSTRAKAYPDGASGYVYAIDDKWTTGISVFLPSALGAEWEGLFRGPYYSYGDNPEYPESGWFSDMKVIDIHPTIAYKVADNFGVGLGIAITYASVELQSPNVVGGMDPETGRRTPLPYHHFFVDGVLEGHGIGFGFNVGLLYDVTEEFHVGLAYRGPVNIPLEGTVTQSLYKPKGGGTLVAEPDAEADFPLPMDLGFGLAYDVNERFTIAADLCWTNWEALDEIEIELDGPGLSDTDGDGTPEPADDTELILHWENTIRYSVGFNYVLVPEKGFDLRLGYYYDPTPIPDETLRPTITDVANKSNVSIGMAYNLAEKLLFEMYWEHVISGVKSADAADNDNDGMFDNVPGDWKMQVDTFGLQFTYMF